MSVYTIRRFFWETLEGGAVLKVEGFNAYNKYRILKHGFKENNISDTCKVFGISRTTFYNWNRAYQKQGMMGLEVKEPKKTSYAKQSEQND